MTIIILKANKYKYGRGLLQFFFGFALEYDMRKVQENQKKRIVWGRPFLFRDLKHSVLPTSCVRSSHCWYS